MTLFRKGINGAERKEPNMSREIASGKNVVLEILKAGKRRVFKVYWSRKAEDAKSEDLKKIFADKRIPVVETSFEKISDLTASREHQGIACEVADFVYADLAAVIETCKREKKGGFLLLLDEIQDPHNVGALIRTAHLCGASGVVLLKHRQALVTNAVCKAAAGAQEHLPIVKEVNLVNVIKLLKENGFFIYGAAGEGGKNIYEERFSFPIGLVLGSEGKGLRRLTAENCDALVTIPMEGEIGSFNVSVAGGILMGEILRQRGLSS